MGYNNNVIDEIKSRVNIVDVIGKVVPLKRAGSNFKGVCPFHNEKTPSFIVSEAKQIFTCFGCGAKGDVIEFVMQYYSLTFGEAVEKLAEEYNIRLDRYSYKKDEKLDRYYEINRLAARFFYDCFTKGKNPGYTYMQSRGISDSTLKKFGIGYADSNWSSLREHLKNQGVTDKEMMTLGLISNKGDKYYDKYRNRVMFPIFNTGGKVIGFGGRILGDGMPKYLNSAESSVFKKKNNLYGLNFTKGDIGNADTAIMVEGYMDMISLYQNGIKNVVASLGTALTDNQARLLSRYTKNIVFSYDSDNAGVNAAYRGIDVIRESGLRARVLKIPGEKDPDDYIRKNGRDSFEYLVRKAMPATEFLLENNKKKYDLTDKLKVLEYVRSTIPIFAKLSPVEKDIYTKKLAEELNISQQAIKMEISGEEKANKSEFRQEKINTDRDEVPIVERNLIKLLIKYPAYIGKISEDKFEFKSDLGKKVLKVIEDKYSDVQVIDLKELVKNFEPDIETAIRDIYDKIVIGAQDDVFYKQCIDSIKYSELKRREAELVDLIAVAEDDTNDEKVLELTKELMKVSEDVRKFRSN